MAQTLEEKRSEETNENQPESERLEDDAEAAKQEAPPQPPEPLPAQQPLVAQPLTLLSPPEEVDGDEHEGVMASKNVVAEVGEVMARDGGKRDDGIYADRQGGRAASAAAEPAAAAATWCCRPRPVATPNFCRS